MSRKTKPGPTGKFPEGKLNVHDEGEFEFAVGHDEGNVILDFGKPVVWLGMGPSLARQLAGLLTRHADEVESKAH